MRSLETWISRISMVLASLVLLAMMLQVVVDVFMRSFLGAGFPATADLVGRYYMVAISFVPLAMTEIGRRHIEATIFTDGLRGTARQAVALAGFCIGLVVFGFLTWGSAVEALSQTGRGAYVEAGTMHFLTWPSYWILPVSFALMELVLAIRVIEVLTGRFELSLHDPLEEIDSHAGEAM
ncbi:TRAP transporter small permease subunit [Stappia sp. GBMRC 2046]|uniref:TRAP transporter small permease protein n=1 Tax=Stappia sediminis TaxID=2692190 RepID=A0A7X3LSQ3_9HYPH|nr:TRAP transporter small permease [Stappia sediminis]MXN64391.1 TRAP transporter small permease subunit [Stappia sediminis]